MSGDYLIVGLGNPGRNYQLTRHNIGFLIIQKFAEQNAFKFAKSLRHKALIAQGQMGDKKVLLVCPQTYMNNSGITVTSLMKTKGIDLSQVLIICDDFHLPFGQLRVRGKGSDGGHNGLASIIERLGTGDFARLRFGIGEPKRKEETSDYVLAPFTKAEQKKLPEHILDAVDCCTAFLSTGMNETMSQFNKRKTHEKI